jgi:hypothetical protein
MAKQQAEARELLRGGLGSLQRGVQLQALDIQSLRRSVDSGAGGEDGRP